MKAWAWVVKHWRASETIDALVAENRQWRIANDANCVAIRQLQARLAHAEKELTFRNETIAGMLEAFEWQVSDAPIRQSKQVLH